MYHKVPAVSSEEEIPHPSPRKWSVARKLVIGGAIALVLLAIGLGVGLGVGLTRQKSNNNSSLPAPKNVTATYKDGLWQPGVGSSWQLVLLSKLDSTDPAGIQIWDIDLFANDASFIRTFQSNGAKVICYFSAGSYEDWRPDAANFTAADLGNGLQGWRGEKWVNVSSPNVRNIMLARLDMAAAQHCDGVDPDNIDGYANDNGLNLTQADAVNYIEFLADAAHARNLSIGLKNAPDIIPDVLSLMQWSVNESCQEYDECNAFSGFIQAGKPVFNVEYPKGPDTNNDRDVSAGTREKLCQGGASYNLSTIIKNYDLDTWIEWC